MINGNGGDKPKHATYIVELNTDNNVEVKGVVHRWHRRVIIEELMPCGRGIEVEYWNAQGELLRKDFTALMAEGVASMAVAEMFPNPNQGD